MAFQAYMTVVAAKQGQFKGEAIAPAHKDTIAVLAFTMEVLSPRDAVTGQATGKRQYQPVSIVKEWGAASPQALTACSTNEVLTTVKIQFYKTAATGVDSVFQTVTLTNAVFQDVRQFTGDIGAAQQLAVGSNAATLERWTLVFQKIQVDNADGKTTFIDDWTSPV
jgi:type VI secretion system secreted protein Hcp